jgi:uridine kinase
VSEARDRVFATLLAQIADFQSEGLTMVAVDGVDGAGKTRFADDLAARLEADGQIAVRVGIEGFLNARAARMARGKDSPEGYFRDSYNLDELRTWLLFPARIGMPFKTAVFDARRDKPAAVNPLIVPLPAVLIFDGPFLNRPELRDEWDLSIFLDVSFEIAFARLAARGGSDPDPDAVSNRRLLEGQKLYLRECRPQRGADIVIDYADLETPKIVRG